MPQDDFSYNWSQRFYCTIDFMLGRTFEELEKDPAKWEKHVKEIAQR